MLCQEVKDKRTCAIFHKLIFISTFKLYNEIVEECGYC